MTIYDSAPSINVHQDLEKMFRETWPEVVLLKGSCTQHHHGSEDTDIFMAAIFFTTHTKTRSWYRKTLSTFLRLYLESLKTKILQKGPFVRTMVAILRSKEGRTPFTGGKAPQQRKISKGQKEHAPHEKQKKTTAAPIKSGKVRPTSPELIQTVEEVLSQHTDAHLPHLGGSKKDNTSFMLLRNRFTTMSLLSLLRNKRWRNARANLAQNLL